MVFTVKPQLEEGVFRLKILIKVLYDLKKIILAPRERIKKREHEGDLKSE